MGNAQDWGTGFATEKRELIGQVTSLEVHHILPKGPAIQSKVRARRESIQLANFCFLTKDTNLKISDRLPEQYFPEVEAKHPGALTSQWIPMDQILWKVQNYRDFLAARRELLATETNRWMLDLLHGGTQWMEGTAKPVEARVVVVGGIATEDEEVSLTALNDWIKAKGLPRGQMAFDYTDPTTGVQLAVFDLAWAQGLHMNLFSRWLCC